MSEDLGLGTTDEIKDVMLIFMGLSYLSQHKLFSSHSFT